MVVPAEVARKSVREAPRYSSGEEGSVTKKSSSEKESSRYSSGGTVGQQEENVKEPQAVLQEEAEPPNSRSEMPEPAGKHLLRHPLGRSSNHNSTNPSHQSNRCRVPKGGAGKSQPKRS
jgi:hypothetical protein